MPLRSGSPHAVRGSVQFASALPAPPGWANVPSPDPHSTRTTRSGTARTRNVFLTFHAIEGEAFSLAERFMQCRARLSASPHGDPERVALHVLTPIYCDGRLAALGRLNARYSPEYAPPPTATMMYCFPSTEYVIGDPL